MQSKFKPGDRVQIVKNAVIENVCGDGSVIGSTGFYPFALSAGPEELQPVPPFQRGNVVQNKRDPHAANMRTVLACFQDEYGVFVFAAEGYNTLFECNRYEIFTQQSSTQ